MGEPGAMVYLDGRLVRQADATVPTDDRGLIFGDGIYEALRFYAGRPFAMDRHITRMKRSAAALDLDIGPLIDALPAATTDLVARNGQPDALVYWQITRGRGPRDRRYPEPARPCVLATTTAADPAGHPGPATVRVILHDDIRWAWRHVKALTLLPSVIAKNRALSAGADDALFCERGLITEATAANALALLDGALWTHPADGGVLAGVTRGIVLEVAAELGLAVLEQPVPVDRLADVAELMLTGTTTRVTAVTHVDGRPVAQGEPGPVTRRLFAGLMERVRQVCL